MMDTNMYIHIKCKNNNFAPILDNVWNTRTVKCQIPNLSNC